MWLQCFAVLGARAQQSTDSSTGTASTATSSSGTQSSSETTSLSYTNSFSVITTSLAESQFTNSKYTYLTYGSQSVVTGSTTSSSETTTTTGTGTGTSGTQSIQTTQHQNVTQISRSSQTGSSTSTAPTASNTVPCNNYPEFCGRKYSNITEVCAHNSAFDIKNNAASNQVLGIVDQLDDGVRMSMHALVNIRCEDADSHQYKARSTGSTIPCIHATAHAIS